MPSSAPALPREAHIEHTVGRVRVRIDGSSHSFEHLPGEVRRNHGAFFDEPVPWEDVKAMIGTRIPGVGVVLDVAVRRAGLVSNPATIPLDPVPSGFHIRLITT